MQDKLKFVLPYGMICRPSRDFE